MKVIQGIFIGTNSLSYETGEIYELVVSPVKFKNIAVTIKRRDGTGWCIYQSLDSFFRNWSFLKGWTE